MFCYETLNSNDHKLLKFQQIKKKEKKNSYEKIMGQPGIEPSIT